MKTIKERAQSYTDKVGILGAYQGYIAGATEQKTIDIDKACEWIINNYLWDYVDESDEVVDNVMLADALRKAMEE